MAYKKSRSKNFGKLVDEIMKSNNKSTTYTVIIDRCSGNKCAFDVDGTQVQAIKNNPNEALKAMGLKPGTIHKITFARHEKSLKAKYVDLPPTRTRGFF